MTLSGTHVVVGVGGGIAAYKATEIVRELGRRGARVRVVMSPSATRFIAPLTFAGLTGQPAVTDLWDPAYPGEVHVALGDWADLIVVAPATANLLARAAAGLADDVLLATLACCDGPRCFAPAMHERMWLQAATQRNVAQLAADGARLIGPVRGPLANGQEGMGRMAEPTAIVDALADTLAEATSTRDLAGRTILITAGPTVEDLDPVRFISNRSSGRMGYALAAQARARGARVVLVSGPVALAPPRAVETVHVRSALEMRDAVRARLPESDAVIMTAAVADYRAKHPADAKLKKSGSNELHIELTQNPDILAELGQQRQGARPVLVGFAMETHDVLTYARRKLEEKRVDLVVANEAAVGFGRDDTQVTLVSAAGDAPLAPMTKTATAHAILDRLATLLAR